MNAQNPNNTLHAAITVKNLKKAYRGNAAPAVNNLSLSVAQGAIFGLLGPNGAGKTTLINILCGLRAFDEGEVSVYGYSLPAQWKEIKTLIGFVPQEIALYPMLTAYENLRFFGGIFGLRGAVLENSVNALLSQFGLEQSKHGYLKNFSGGMKRRVNLIAGILHRPKILFLDEPTAGVDVQSKNVILESLREINRQGATIIYTSHYMEEAETLCSRVAFIDEGKVICEGNPAEMVKQQPDCASLEMLYLQLTGKKLRD
ncbi:MAG: ABC transporter ATP-binding protein [Prevotellaceae bacterium]|jgi:ABC-2 type transport system ATP-binding protein|nr:ABC transporter ATP-binding protein [Prevotellaceae bacterium]